MWKLCEASPPASLHLAAPLRQGAIGRHRRRRGRAPRTTRRSTSSSSAMRAAAASTSSRKIWPASMSSVPSGPRPSRAACRWSRSSLRLPRPKGPQPHFTARKPRVAGRAATGQRLRRRVAEKLRSIGQLRIGLRVTQKLVDRHAALAAEQVPQRHLDSGECMCRLQQVHALHLDSRGQGGDIVGAAQGLSEHHVAHRLAGAMRHGTDEGGDRGERRGLAFAPAHHAACGNPHQQGILAAIAGIGHHRHGEIEKVDGFDLHQCPRQTRNLCSASSFSVTPRPGVVGKGMRPSTTGSSTLHRSRRSAESASSRGRNSM